MTNLIQNVPPGTVREELIRHVSETMMSTIQECAMTPELLESGDLEGAFNALLQMRINSAVVQETIERALGMASEFNQVTKPHCIRCRRQEDPGQDADWVWLLPCCDRNLCSDCDKPEDAPIIGALLALHNAAQALHNQIKP